MKIKAVSKLGMQMFAVGAIVVSSWMGAELSFASEIRSRVVNLHRTVTQNSPVVVIQGAPRYVEAVDVNWEGARGRDVMARVLADGLEVWSGMIPGYDPTFRATVRSRVSRIELRVDYGAAYVNWAQVYEMEEETAPQPNPGCGSRVCSPDFIGSLTEADDLAWSLVRVINELQGKVTPAEVSANLLPLKIAAAKVFAIAKANGNHHQSEVYQAVYGLEEQFVKQEAFITSLFDTDATFNEAVTLLTIRQRYKALFGYSRY